MRMEFYTLSIIIEECSFNSDPASSSIIQQRVPSAGRISEAGNFMFGIFPTIL